MNVLIVDTNGAFKSAALATHLLAAYAAHSFTARGVSQARCTVRGGTFITQANIDAASVIVFCNSYHYEMARLLFQTSIEGIRQGAVSKKIVILDVAEYTAFPTGAAAIAASSEYDDYLMQAEQQLKPLLG